MNKAKYYYEMFNKINPPTSGAYVLDSNKHKNEQLQSLNKCVLPYVWQEIKQYQNKHPNCKGTIFMPSPWHTWISLKSLHDAIIENNLFGVPIYRGQANSDYPLIPSLYREGTNRSFEEDSFKAFSFLFNQEFLWQNLDILPIDSAKATAQHYGVKTNLLDITADPAVAVYFASRSNNRKQGENAAVFVSNLASFSLPNINFILPPPTVERLYTQRGAFLKIPESAITESQEKFYKVVFPFDKNFKFLENGAEKELDKPDEWFESAIRWSKKWADCKKPLPRTKSEKDKLLAEVFEAIGYPGIFQEYNSPMLILVHWIENFENMVDWYGMRIKNNQEGLLSHIGECIARDNPELIQLVIQIYDASRGKERRKNTWAELLELAQKNIPH